MQSTEKEKALEGFLKRYKKIPYIIVYKTLDYSESLGEAFDILEDFKIDLPVEFDLQTKRWVSAFLTESFVLQENI